MQDDNSKHDYFADAAALVRQSHAAYQLTRQIQRANLEYVTHMHPNRVRGTDRMIDDLNAREDDASERFDGLG